MRKLLLAILLLALPDDPQGEKMTVAENPVWPLESVGDRHPCMTGNQWSPPGHTGVDLVFPRMPGDPSGHFDGQFSRGNALYFTPFGAHCIACEAGKVVYARPDKNGFRVRLATFTGVHLLNLHLENLLVTPTHEWFGDEIRKISNGGQLLLRKQRLGVQGGDPTDKGPPRAFVHDHFELRVPATWAQAAGTKLKPDGWGMVPIDPKPYLNACAFT